MFRQTVLLELEKKIKYISVIHLEHIKHLHYTVANIRDKGTTKKLRLNFLFYFNNGFNEMVYENITLFDPLMHSERVTVRIEYIFCARTQFEYYYRQLRKIYFYNFKLFTMLYIYTIYNIYHPRSFIHCSRCHYV